MARDPFAEMESSGLATPSSTSSSTSLVLRVVTGVSVLAMLGLAFGYYLPLRNAHTLLNEKYLGSNAELGGTTDQLRTLTEQLKKAQGELSELAGEAKEREQVEQSSRERVGKLGKELETALARFTKSKQVVLSERDGASVVTVDDKHVFGPRDTAPSQKGKKLLCDVGKAIKGLSVSSNVEVSGHTASNKVADVVLRRDFPTVWELSAARAAGATAALQSCGIAAANLRAVGDGNSRPEEGAKGSTGELRLTLTPR